MARANTIVRLVITPGEPAGIGPDLVVQLAQTACAADWVVVADPELLQARAALLNLPLQLKTFDAQRPPAAQASGELRVLATPLRAPAICGQLDAANSPYVVETLEHALQLCRSGSADAWITGPVQKSILNDAGIPFTGHTEWIAERCGVRLPVMMLASGSLRVALATTHLPLRAVPDALTRNGLVDTLTILAGDLRTRFGIASPRILCCGLNPHAGEGGHLGREEIDVIEPALRQARATGINVIGPLPADTLFTPTSLREADAVLAMYHDQGLPVLKHAGFGHAVNVTLGLPIVRTSVDHGTALELAGTGRADAGSFQAAIAMAQTLSERARASG